MYRMVNQAVRGLVLDVFGEDAWRDISHKAKSPEEFASLRATMTKHIQSGLCSLGRARDECRRCRSRALGNIGSILSRPSITPI